MHFFNLQFVPFVLLKRNPPPLVLLPGCLPAIYFSGVGYGDGTVSAVSPLALVLIMCTDRAVGEDYGIMTAIDQLELISSPRLHRYAGFSWLPFAIVW